MSGPDPMVVRRDCPVTLIPSGRPAILARGEQVQAVQQLGASLTVQVVGGPLARIDGGDFDAVGMEPPAETAPPSRVDGAFDPDAVLERLRGVYDPEIPVNVVDLGLVYRCQAVPLGGGRHRVEIDMSMTAPGCGMGDVLRDEARRVVLALPGVAEVDVQLVWDPPWDMTRLSDAARLELGLW
ncbi:putative Fe-S cluster assembly protein SufT [Acidiferrimicrobium sp. IK]|uniref:putative Fe-S cluster assembly protein SufT n=1 Tax=Acidiferrimicrobium sp. IK TaxID=2871700 RepID=UPI0021CB0CE8|nr:putative Fe-S cluster assembly protein SufT [Acidiferrimicrobium sp. IK]MCU4182986.1 putative Fe-S cluster assembly protein SufT [Acidiferrimicrobium sp. IK]